MAWLKLSKPKNKKDSVNGNTPHHDKVRIKKDTLVLTLKSEKTIKEIDRLLD